jgi:hypothetical protein
MTAEVQNGRSVCSDAILDWMQSDHHLSGLPDILRHVIRQTDTFERVLGIPTKSGRCHVAIEAIQEHFQRLAQELENVPAVSILHTDESGFQDLVDSGAIQVVVPVAFPHDSIPISSNRSEKRAAMLAAISADGSSLKPMVIIQRKTSEVGLFESGFTPEKVVTVHRERGFIGRFVPRN